MHAEKKSTNGLLWKERESGPHGEIVLHEIYFINNLMKFSLIVKYWNQGKTVVSD
jgi:hypothetical protein